MSVLLSILILGLFSIAYIGYNALQIFGFRDMQEDRMVLGLSAVFHDAKISVDILGRNSQHIQILGRADVIGTAAGDQDPTGAQHLERPKVELFITTKGGLQI